MTQRIPYQSTGQRAIHIAPVSVVSATFLIERLDVDPLSQARVLQSGDATINDDALTLTAPAGVSQLAARRIEVNSTTIDIGEVGLIEALDGSAREHFVVAGKGADYLIAEHYLTADYPAGARVVRPTLAFLVDDSIAAEVEYVESATPLRIVWSYALAGSRQIVRERLEVVRGTDSDAGVASIQLELREAYPDIAERIPSSAELGGFIRFAQGQVMRMLRSRGIEPDLLMAGDAGRNMVFWRAIVHMAENGHVPANRDPEAWLADAQKHYRDVVADVTRGGPGSDATELDRRDRAIPSKARQVFAQL